MPAGELPTAVVATTGTVLSFAAVSPNTNPLNVIPKEGLAPPKGRRAAVAVTVKGAFATVRLTLATPLPLALEAPTVRVKSPATRGVPRMTPEVASKTRPVGKPTAENPSGDRVAVIWYSNAVPYTPATTRSLVIVGYCGFVSTAILRDRAAVLLLPRASEKRPAATAIVPDCTAFSGGTNVTR